MNAPAASLLRAAAALVPGFAVTAAAHDRSGQFPRENLTALRAAGLLALTVPRRLGGLGAGLAQSAEIIATLAQGEPATALVATMQTIQHAGLARSQIWPAHLYERVARSAVEQGALINALRVEPELGTPARGGLPATIARRPGELWRLSGRKTFCTGIPVLTWLAVWACTDEAAPRVGMFLVPADAPGITIEPNWDQLGMRASESHDVVFDDVALPADHAVDLRAPEDWTGPDPQTGAWNATLVGALYHGIARAARDWLGGWLHERVPANLGAPLATLPRMQAEFGAIDGMLRLDARLLRGFAEAVDAGDAPPPAEAGLLKQRLTANAITAVQRALALTGNAGLARRNPLERHLRDVLCGPVHTPQDDSVFLAAGRAALAEFKGILAMSQDNVIAFPELEFIGMIQPRQQSEIHPVTGPGIDLAYLRASAQAHDRGGFDRILIGWHSNGPDGFLIATHAAAHTERVGFLVAHRPGFQSPTTAARSFATLDQLSGGRAAIHVISGGDDADQQRDGDWLDKDARYARTDEYVGILKRIWTGTGPVDHAGPHYRIVGASTDLRTHQSPRIPIYFGGASTAAIDVAGRHADVYALWGETHAQVREIVARVRASAARHGRIVRFSLSFRPILAETEERAWQRAEDIAATVRRLRGPARAVIPNEGSRRLLEAAALGDRPEGRLYTAIALATGARGNSTALVGTPEQVAEAFREYHALGVSTFLIRGFDPLEDAVEYGRSLLPATRHLLARSQRVAAE